MRRLIPLALIGMTLGATGCASSHVPLNISANVPAMVTAHALKGAGANIEECPTPCAITVDKESLTRVSLRADGYLPAVIDLAGEDLWMTRNATAREPVYLVLPLYPRTGHVRANTAAVTERATGNAHGENPGPVPASESLENRLREIQKLHADGFLSDQEYRSKRRQILDRF